jgi:hypothetical protein
VSFGGIPSLPMACVNGPVMLTKGAGGAPPVASDETMERAGWAGVFGSICCLPRIPNVLRPNGANRQCQIHCANTDPREPPRRPLT